jgi:hypothetical protein
MSALRVNSGTTDKKTARRPQAAAYLIAAIHSLGISSDFSVSGTLSWTPDPPWTAKEADTVAASNAAAFDPNTLPILTPSQ